MTKPVFDLKKALLMTTFCALPFFATAQESAQKSAPPPDLELIDEVEQPAITIRKPEETDKITERRDNGTVKQIKVETGGSTYYLYPHNPVGSAMRGDVTTTTVRPALWRIHEFDIGEGKAEDKEAQQEAETQAPGMPPPAVKP